MIVVYCYVLTSVPIVDIMYVVVSVIDPMCVSCGAVMGPDVLSTVNVFYLYYYYYYYVYYYY